MQHKENLVMKLWIIDNNKYFQVYANNWTEYTINKLDNCVIKSYLDVVGWITLELKILRGLSGFLWKLKNRNSTKQLKYYRRIVTTRTQLDLDANQARNNSNTPKEPLNGLWTVVGMGLLLEDPKLVCIHSKLCKRVYRLLILNPNGFGSDLVMGFEGDH